MEQSNDIYSIAARVKNHARENGSLTPVGEQMCNLYVHVIKSFYTFAETLPEQKREELKTLITEHELFPAILIAATKRK